MDRGDEDRWQSQRRDSLGSVRERGYSKRVGVYNHSPYLTVLAIQQRYAGHAKQAGLAAVSCAASARNGRYVVVVDEDIDPSNLKEVLWARERLLERCCGATGNLWLFQRSYLREVRLWLSRFWAKIWSCSATIRGGSDFWEFTARTEEQT